MAVPIYIYIPWHKENDCTQLEKLGKFDDKDLDWKLNMSALLTTLKTSKYSGRCHTQRMACYCYSNIKMTLPET